MIFLPPPECPSEQLRFRIGLGTPSFEDSRVIFVNNHLNAIPFKNGYMEQGFGGCVSVGPNWTTRLAQQYMYASYVFSVTYLLLNEQDDLCQLVNRLVFYLKKLACEEYNKYTRQYYEYWHGRLVAQVAAPMPDPFHILARFQQEYKTHWSEDDEYQTRWSIMLLCTYRGLSREMGCDLLQFLVHKS